ncbi:M20/M25/M40 family metallo-hydrolase [Longimicrobium sp.]|uniref:M20/M25/M40 family metallo-hydrolase n=1 Tax=Longimicrobium sp. TaxID=2029185 RepID=UPI002E31CEF6|nr:M20/M25/M40 family metallo-hydrolase [Longimicrobium sp.]HEX6037460.1 M20/M25/M40 family metallo-hydrolase [Longimicrobium sp.]
MAVDFEHLVRTLGELVRINSINPAFSGGTTDERQVADYVRAAMDALGMETHAHEPAPGRVSVVGRLRGTEDGPSLLLYAHHDTVGIEGMPDPWAAEVRDGRMYGRGAYDMKCGLAACLSAAKTIVDAGRPLAGDLLIASVADEEEASLGMMEVLRHHTADAAVVTEPTELAMVVAHKGFCWIEVETEGRAAHGSGYQVGIDANVRMGRVLARLEALGARLVASDPHPVVGPPSLHAATLRGGTGWSTYAARCVLRIERRTIPGETETDAVAQVQAIVDALSAEDETFRATVRPVLSRDAWEARPDAAITAVVADAAEAVLGRAPVRMGAPYWMDTSLIGAAGIDAVVIGPAGEGAHAAVEWVDLESVRQTAEILVRTARAFCG